MTAAVEQSWIEGSLARLEELEARRDQLMASGQTHELAELNEEIRALYEALESVAGEGNDEAANEAAAPTAAAPTAAAAPAFTPDTSMAPPAMGAADMAPTQSYDDDLDLEPRRSKTPLIIAAVVVLVGGIGALLALGGDKDSDTAKQDAGPAKVIKAGAIVEDTQEPIVAKGGDADRSAGTTYKQGSEPAKPTTKRSGSTSASRAARRARKKEEARRIKFEGGKDPLAGVE